MAAGELCDLCEVGRRQEGHRTHLTIERLGKTHVVLGYVCDKCSRKILKPWEPLMRIATPHLDDANAPPDNN